jgi:hypothetical protein
MRIGAISANSTAATPLMQLAFSPSDFKVSATQPFLNADMFIFLTFAQVPKGDKPKGSVLKWFILESDDGGYNAGSIALITQWIEERATVSEIVESWYAGYYVPFVKSVDENNALTVARIVLSRWVVWIYGSEVARTVCEIAHYVCSTGRTQISECPDVDNKFTGAIR